MNSIYAVYGSPPGIEPEIIFISEDLEQAEDQKAIFEAATFTCSILQYEAINVHSKYVCAEHALETDHAMICSVCSRQARYVHHEVLPIEDEDADHHAEHE